MNATPARPGPLHLAIGFVTNFFDTLGIGSYATTTAVYRLRRLVADELIPGTLNLGHALPILLQAVIFIGAVEVDTTTLASMIAAAVVGAWLGAGTVARMSRRGIQAGMGAALVAAAILLLLMNLGRLPAGGDAVQLAGTKLALAVAANFVFGALMTIGVGLYAPCMILVSLLGMNPVVAFPIMMGSCACLAPVAGIKFVRTGRYDLRAALGLAIGGVPAVLLAAYLVRSLPLQWLRWLVLLVVLYTAAGLLRAACRRPQTPTTT